MAEQGKIRIGIGGWTYKPWRGAFYPDGLRQADELSYAAEALTAIEINGTFYGAQKPETFAKWRASVPDGFRFSVKAPRFAVNRRVLSDAGESIEKFITGGVTELGDALGPILWQFAGTKQFDADDFARFLELLPESHDGVRFSHALEPRHESFRVPEFARMARAKGAAIVWDHDGKYPEIADQTADFAYIRILGTSEDEPLGYSDAALDRLAAQIRGLAEGEAAQGVKLAADHVAAPRDVYAFVIAGHKVANPAAAKALIARVG